MKKFPKRIRAVEQSHQGLPTNSGYWVGRECDLGNGLTIYRATNVWVKPGGQLWIGKTESPDGIFHLFLQQGAAPPWEDAGPEGVRMSIIDLNTGHIEIWDLPNKPNHPAEMSEIGMIMEVRDED